MGCPTAREGQGHGAWVVVVGVTSHQGGRESRLQGQARQVISILREREVREMRSAEQVLGIIQERGKRGLPLQDLYRQLYNPNLYLKAYGKIYRNAGATRLHRETTLDQVTSTRVALLVG